MRIEALGEHEVCRRREREGKRMELGCKCDYERLDEIKGMGERDSGKKPKN